MGEFEGLAELRALAHKLGRLTCLTPPRNSGDTQGLEIRPVSAVSPVSPRNNDALQRPADTCSDIEAGYRLAERAAILEFDGGMARAEAERLARADVADLASGVDMGST